jgi:plastocyanin
MRIALLAVLTLTLSASGSFLPAPAAKTHTVTIDATRYTPAALTVAPGDTVIWQNKDILVHTATSTVGAFDSKDIKPGGSWKYVVPKKGLFEYYCTLHPAMKASLRVR